LEVLFFVHKHPGSSIIEVAEALGISYQTAQRYLRELRGRGKLDVKLGDKDVRARNVQRFYPHDSVKVNPVLLNLEEIIKGMLEEEE
jgi:predicted ArsR family transcriptional regulator